MRWKGTASAVPRSSFHQSDELQPECPRLKPGSIQALAGLKPGSFTQGLLTLWYNIPPAWAGTERHTLCRTLAALQGGFFLS